MSCQWHVIWQILSWILLAIIEYNLHYKCSKMRCAGKMAPPDENLVNAHSQHRQNFSSRPGTSNFWTLVVHPIKTQLPLALALRPKHLGGRRPEPDPNILNKNSKTWKHLPPPFFTPGVFTINNVKKRMNWVYKGSHLSTSQQFLLMRQCFVRDQCLQEAAKTHRCTKEGRRGFSL